MSSIKSLAELWALPDRSADRMQITLRLNGNEYARLHALKEVFPNRSINDMLNDIIRAGLDELVESLPFTRITKEDVIEEMDMGIPSEHCSVVGTMYGLRAEFDKAYRRMLEQKSEEKPDLKAVQTQEQIDPKEAA